jgi:hypothetical protein
MALKELDAHPELRDDPSIKDFNDLPTFAKAFKDTKAFVGSSIRPPGPDATPEARKEFYDKLVKHAPDLVPLRENDAEAEKLVWNKLGRPDKPEGYSLKDDKGNDLTPAGLREVAAEAGLTVKQFQALAKKSIAASEAAALASEADQKGLKTEWGVAYDTKLKSAAAVAQKLGLPPEVVGSIMAGKMSSNQLKVWDAIATGLGAEGSGPVGVKGGGGPDVLTPAEAQARFREVQSHPGYFNKNHPEHDTLVAKGIKLMEMLHPG